MKVFEPFLRLEIEHAFFGDGVAPIDLEPDAATRRLFQRPDLSARARAGHVDIFATQTRDDLTLLAEDGALTFTFRARPHDPMLFGSTRIVDLADDKIAVASVAAGDATEIGEDHLRPRKVDDVITAMDVVRPPLAILTVAVPVDARNELRRVRFLASRRRWTYYILGGDPNDDIAVRDSAGAVDFDRLDNARLSNGREARSFRSKTPIAARARPPERFELVGAGEHGERVLIPILPCPAPGSPRPARDDADGAPVSEIYVNLP